MPERIDADRVIVTGRSAGNQFPRTQATIQYRFEADGTGPDGPFDIDGSVYGRDIRFRGPGTVGGPVLGRGDITLSNEETSPQRFFGGLHANGNLGCDGPRRPPINSPIDDVRKSLYVVRGDVVARNVVLRNAVVFGSIRATNITLEHCIVFGQLVAKERCTVACSTIMAYQAPKVELRGPCAFFFASGESHSAPEWLDYTDSVGRKWPWSAKFYPLTRRSADFPIGNRPWRDGDASPDTLLVHADWVRTEVVEVHQKAGSAEALETHKERYVLSIGPRALDFASIEASVLTTAWLFGSALEWGHYAEPTREEVRRRVTARCSPQEAHAFDIATVREPLHVERIPTDGTPSTQSVPGVTAASMRAPTGAGISSPVVGVSKPVVVGRPAAPTSWNSGLPTQSADQPASPPLAAKADISQAGPAADPMVSPTETPATGGAYTNAPSSPSRVPVKPPSTGSQVIKSAEDDPTQKSAHRPTEAPAPLPAPAVSHMEDTAVRVPSTRASMPTLMHFSRPPATSTEATSTNSPAPPIPRRVSTPTLLQIAPPSIPPTEDSRPSAGPDLPEPPAGTQAAPTQSINEPSSEDILALFGAFKSTMQSIGLDGNNLKFLEFSENARRAWARAAEQLPGRSIRLVPFPKDGRVSLRVEVVH